MYSIHLSLHTGGTDFSSKQAFSSHFVDRLIDLQGPAVHDFDKLSDLLHSSAHSVRKDFLTHSSVHTSVGFRHIGQAALQARANPSLMVLHPSAQLAPQMGSLPHLVLHDCAQAVVQ